MSTITTKQQAVLNTKSAMDIIISEAKANIANKFEVSIEYVEVAIAVKNENVMSMMRKLVESGVKQAAAAL